MKKTIILFLILCAALREKEMCAQEGEWVAYSLTGFSPGAAYHDCDDGCIGYTRANARYVLIFDIKIGEWILADMGKARNFKYLQTKGGVMLAWSEG